MYGFPVIYEFSFVPMMFKALFDYFPVIPALIGCLYFV